MKKLIAVLALALAACTTVSGPKEVGRFTNPANDKEYIALYNEQGECPQPSKSAVLEYQGTHKGCYELEDGVVYLSIDNGPMLAIPQESFGIAPAKPKHPLKHT
jgi:hypothetical protein